ncbi:MAG: hypothetical protein HY553_07440 [Elusimicrobia bacterium]|nr:hypothetical protein [Elusimicrobiota bacterium]
MRLALVVLVLSSGVAHAGKLYRDRVEDRDRKKLEKVEQLSQTGAQSGTSEAGAYRAGKPFTGITAGAAGGRAAVPVAESEYVPTAAGSSLTSGGPVRGTPYLANCPKSDTTRCKNATPYQREMNSILKDIKKALLELKMKILAKSIPMLAGLGALASLTYVLLVGLARKVIRFARRTDQKEQGRLLAATAYELQQVAEDVRKDFGSPVSMSEIDRRVKKAGEKARKRIEKNLEPKE